MSQKTAKYGQKLDLTVNHLQSWLSYTKKECNRYLWLMDKKSYLVKNKR